MLGNFNADLKTNGFQYIAAKVKTNRLSDFLCWPIILSLKTISKLPLKKMFTLTGNLSINN